MILFLVCRQNLKYLCFAAGREHAKIKARDHLKGDPDNYIITPLTEKGDTVYIGAIEVPTFKISS